MNELIIYSWLSIERVSCVRVWDHYVTTHDNGELRNVNEYYKIDIINKYNNWEVWHGVFSDNKAWRSMVSDCVRNNYKHKGEELMKYQRLLDSILE